MSTINQHKYRVGDTPLLKIYFKQPDGSATDVSSATLQEATLVRPDGTTATITTTYIVSGADGGVQAQATSAHLTQRGHYTLYAVVEKSGGLRYTSADYVFYVAQPGAVN